MISLFERHRRISILITILIAAFIFYMSSRTFPSSVSGSDINSIIYHVGIFFLLGLFLMITLNKRNNRLMPIAILIAVIYGVFDEIHHFFVPERFASLVDVAYNSLGIFYAAELYSIRNIIKNAG